MRSGGHLVASAHCATRSPNEIQVAILTRACDHPWVMKLTLSEEILLLCLDDQTGRLRSMPERALDYAIGGAVLADLAILEIVRVSERHCEIVTNEARVEDPVLARSLEIIKEVPSPSLNSWLNALAGQARALRTHTLDRLIERDILKREKDEILWVFRAERYETLDLSEEIEVQQRIRAVVLDPAKKPSREDTVLVALIEVCELGPLMFSHAEFERSRERIRQIAQSDCIGCAVRQALTEIQRAMLEIRAYSGM